MKIIYKHRLITKGLIIFLLSIIFIFPICIIFLLSISDEKSIIENGLRVIPSNVTFNGYVYIYKNYFNSIKFTFLQSIISTIFSVLIMSLGSFVLSRKKYFAHKLLNKLVYVSYFVKWGYVVTFFINTRILNLYNTIFVYIIPNIVDIFFILLLRNFYSKIDNKIYDLAYIDGASEKQIFFKVALPISLPILISVSVITFIYRWNDWFTSMIYVQDDRLFTLQYYLQRINNEETFFKSMIRLTSGSNIIINDLQLTSIK